MTKMMSKYDVSKEFDPKEYLRLMSNLTEAFFKLSEYCEINGVDFQDFITEHFPFDLSLDAMAYEVMAWEDAAREILEKEVQK